MPPTSESSRNDVCSSGAATEEPMARVRGNLRHSLEWRKGAILATGALVVYPLNSERRWMVGADWMMQGIQA